MPLFIATYLDKDHTGMSKEFISDSKQSLNYFLSQKGYQYISIRRIWFYSQLNDKRKAQFFQSCADLIESGLNLQESLKIYADQTSHKILKILALELLNNLVQGRNIFETDSNEFFDEFVLPNLNQICSNQSNLSIFRLISNYYFEKVENKKKLNNVLAYPLITLIVLGVSLYFALFMILPSVLQLVPAERITAATRSLIYLKDHIIQILMYGSMVLIFVLSGRKYLIYIPFIARLEVMDFWSQMSFCLMNQFHFVQALNIIKDNFNPRISRHIYCAIENMNRGMDIASSFLKFPGVNKTQLHLLKLGEISGCMEKNLKFINEQEQKFKKNIRDKIIFWTQPFLLLMMGGVLLWILLGTVIPIYENFQEMGI